MILITGGVNSGKTGMMKRLANKEKAAGNQPSGITAEGIFAGGEKAGFNVKDLSSGESMPLAKISPEKDNGFSAGKYFFSNEGFEFAKKALMNYSPGGVVFLDEAGPLELAGKGYAGCLKTLLKSPIKILYVSVRSGCLDKIREKFFRGTKIIKILGT
ncbi:MAG: nucleoside-triphosphatase [bacterium]